MPGLPGWESGPGPADPAISASYDATYQGSGYGPPLTGTINVGAPVSVGPQYPAAQLRFYIQGGNLYALDNVSRKSFFVAPSSTVPIPPVYAPAK